MKLKKCPCGKTPEKLSIMEGSTAKNAHMEGSTAKWAFVGGHCCGEWLVEFRTNYLELDSDECYDLAVAAWNRNGRWDDETSA